VFGEVEASARRNHPDYRNQRNRQLWGEPMTKQNAARDKYRQTQCRKIEPWQALQDLVNLNKRPVRACLHTEHVAEHRDANLEPNAGEKSDQHRVRKEISEEPQLEDPRQ